MNPMTPDAESLIPEVTAVVCETFHLDPGTLTPGTPLAEAGIDSKRRVRLLATLEVRYDVTIDLDDRARFTTITAVAEVLAEALHQRRRRV